MQKLDDRQNPRRITPEEHAILVEKLRDGIRGPVAVQEDWTDGEATQFGNDILSVLTDAGFEIRTANAQILSMNTLGVLMFVQNVTNAPAHAILIQRAFSESGVIMQGMNAAQARRMDEVIGGTNSNLVVIWVSQKP